MYSWTEIERDRNTEGQKNIEADRKREAPNYKQSYIQTVRPINIQTDKQTDL